ncbi:MAG: sigma 54-interacting transcriptional regulator [Acidobacteriota bacterium]
MVERSSAGEPATGLSAATEGRGGLRRDFEGLRRELQLQTFYDLLIALHAHASEEELLEDLLQRLCAVVDPAVAIAVTRDPLGGARAVAAVGWAGPGLNPEEIFGDPLLADVLREGEPIRRRAGSLLDREFDELRAVPMAYRGTMLGLIVVLDKEGRHGSAGGFTTEDRRFLQAVAALGAVTVDGLRQVESLMSLSERLEEENKLLREQLVHEVEGQRIVAEAVPMRRVLQMAERVAPRSVNVLIRGESGTGKELVAKLLHQRSGRSGPLVAVNCAALPETLLESELFGIEGGVATGVQARIGKFELADGGTLFLDEIGDLDLALQVKLLRALQEREIVRVGGHRAKSVDVRLVTATHRSLEELVSEGGFREDLYYRLKGIEVEMPALRDRLEDVPHLVRHFVAQFCDRESLTVPQVTSGALALLMAHDYPGNVRELQSVIEGAVALADGTIDRELLSPLLRSRADEGTGPEALDLETVERRHIRRVLEITDGNKSAASRILGIDRRTLSRKGF